MQLLCIEKRTHYKSKLTFNLFLFRKHIGNPNQELSHQPIIYVHRKLNIFKCSVLLKTLPKATGFQNKNKFYSDRNELHMLEYVLKVGPRERFAASTSREKNKKNKKNKARTNSDLIQPKYHEFNNFNEYSTMEKKYLKSSICHLTKLLYFKSFLLSKPVF